MSDVPPDVGAIAGPQLIGHLFNWGLFGALTVQVYIYYIAFPKDRAYRKALVIFVFVMELAQTVMATHDAFSALASGWGTPGALDHIYWSCVDVPIMSSILSCTIQLFYAWRIYMFSESRVKHRVMISLTVVVLAILELIAALITGAECFRIQHLSLLPIRAIKTCALWLSSSALCDAIIAGTMTFLLWGHRTQSHIPQRRSFLSRLINIIIGGGTVTAAVASFNVVVFFAAKSTDLFSPPAIILSKLYTNSLLVQLNARIQISGSRDDNSAAYVADLGRMGHLNSLESVKPTGYKQSLAVFSPASNHQTGTHPGMDSAALKLQVFSSKNDENI